jgi:hypothetical protein
MITKYLGATIVVLLIALLGAGMLYQHTVEAKAVAEAQRDGYLEALNFQSDQIKKRDELLQQREQQRLKAEQAANTWRKKWREAQRNDADCENWADVGLPECVIRMFQQPGSSSDKQPATTGVFDFNP